jgi:hypothetical protein
VSRTSADSQPVRVFGPPSIGRPILRLGISKRSKFHSTAWILTLGLPMGQFHVILVMLGYGLIPVPPHLWHLTILSPFLRVPFPSQFLHFCFFCPVFFRMESSKAGRSNLRPDVV